MKRAVFALAAAAGIALGTSVAACSNSSGGSSASRPNPTVTVTHQAAPPASTAPASTAPPATAVPSAGSGTSSPNPPADTNVTDPWAVVSAYYGDIESGNYQQAWALIGSGSTTSQTYQQFVDGYSCTGQQDLTEVSESGDQVTFDLAATDSCSGQVQNFIGTDTVQNGTIVAAHVRSTG